MTVVPTLRQVSNQAVLYMKPGIESKKNRYLFATPIVQRRARRACIDKAISSVEIVVGQTVLAVYWFEWGFDDKVVL